MSKLDTVGMAPPATLVAITLYGITLQDWVLIFSLVLILLQLAWFVYDKVQILRGKKKRPGHGDG